ncbi:MSMEG_1061 family FMN-dependent PPOX-type flavoprotein [Psychromonas ossibalaenae]|uniref:MSMEG_1061 family FMN-dependent PPOX-type flavoprotein n=1 Tax=Psychromonas ossibalaenae TaxID=444922 RepID=UPI00035EA57D|nr:MSMEG_1061 family FMN-dependent PPOX-type flavoprotein [Psychromonas ossibalaenae]
MQQIQSRKILREMIGKPNPVAAKKIYDHLNPRMKNFISQSPLVMLSTIDDQGFPTISPKGDKPGFVKVTQDNKLFIPELRGNKLAFSLTNILEHNKVALIFILPGTTETLRVHGTCRLLSGELICKQMASLSHSALLVMEVTVNNAYFHCGKALLRSQAWQSDTWPEVMKISFGREIAENTGADSSFIEQVDDGIKSRSIADL